MFSNKIKKINRAGIDPRFAKTKEYQKTLEKIIISEKCPFCPDNFKYHQKPILKRYKKWFVTENSWPYDDTKYHLLFISDKHLETIAEMQIADWTAIDYLLKWTIKKFDIKGGGIAFRFGEQKYTGASVLHLHLHLIVPKLKKDNKTARSVCFPFG